MRATAARASLGANGGCVVTADLDEAVAVANRFAPEHLQVAVAADVEDRVVAGLVNAGEILVGQHTPFSAANFVDRLPGVAADLGVRHGVVGHHGGDVPQAHRRRPGRRRRRWPA